MESQRADKNSDRDLKERFRKLAFEKSELQLLVNMMAKLNLTSDLGDVINRALQSIMTVIGATNIILFYQQDARYFSVDVFGGKQRVAVLDDLLVLATIESAAPNQIESPFDATMMTYPTEDYRAFTWVYPLLIGTDVIGVIKVENTACSMQGMSGTLPVFFNYLAQILKNELQNINRLKEAYGKLEKLNSDLENRVKQRTIELKNSNSSLLESEEKYRSMMESMKDAVYICSPGLRIGYMNPAMVNRIGRNATGESCHKAIYGLDEQCSWCLVDRVQRKEYVEYEMADSKHNRHYSVTTSPICHTDGTVSQLTIFSRYYCNKNHGREPPASSENGIHRHPYRRGCS